MANADSEHDSAVKEDDETTQLPRRIEKSRVDI
jgi:hypothetical protein